MRSRSCLFTVLSASLVMMTAGCSSSEPTPADTRETDERRYDARAFFTTTSYWLSPGFAWSHDVRRC